MKRLEALGLQKEPEMNTMKREFVKAAVMLLAITVFGSTATGGESQPMHNHAGHGMAQPGLAVKKPAMIGLDAIYAKQLPAIQDALQKVIQHLEAGHSQMALAELKKVQESLQAVHKALGLHVGPQFVNSRCPIMGSPINAEKVTADLVRTYQGQKVAFCCPSCPATWDQLTDAQKQAKLKLVTSNNTPHQH
jgi:hypothetical protein